MGVFSLKIFLKFCKFQPRYSYILEKRVYTRSINEALRPERDSMSVMFYNATLTYAKVSNVYSHAQGNLVIYLCILVDYMGLNIQSLAKAIRTV